MSQELWRGRSSSTQALDPAFNTLNASFPFDYRLWSADLEGSIAHIKGLAAAQILNPQETRELLEGLAELKSEISLCPEAWFAAMSAAEDIHSALELSLIAKIGDLGKKMHTARSRNDQVATDLRLYLRGQSVQIAKKLQETLETLINLAERDCEILLPGYTHLQRAQGITLGHYWLCQFERLMRDLDRLKDSLPRLNRCPLGSGALAGVGYDLDRSVASKNLGFAGLCQNSLDAVSDRDFVAEFQFVASLLMVHLSGLAEDLILWSSAEFAFLELSPSFATGSSMMPQKRNPDYPELLRGKTGRVTGNLLALLITLKGLPVAYNKDLQEDKEGLFDTCDTLSACLSVLSPFLLSLKFQPQKMKEALAGGFTEATDAADYLVQRGLPFREAYRLVGELVQRSIEGGLSSLSQLSLDEFRAKSALFEGDIQAYLGFEACLARRKSIGGTAPETVRAASELARNRLAELVGDPLEHPC